MARPLPPFPISLSLLLAWSLLLTAPYDFTSCPLILILAGVTDLIPFFRFELLAPRTWARLLAFFEPLVSFFCFCGLSFPFSSTCLLFGCWFGVLLFFCGSIVSSAFALGYRDCSPPCVSLIVVLMLLKGARAFSASTGLCLAHQEIMAVFTWTGY